LSDTKKRKSSVRSFKGKKENPLRVRRLFSKLRSRKSGASRNKTKIAKNLKTKIVKAIYIFIGFGFFVLMACLIFGGIYLKNLESSLPNPNKLIDRSSALSTQIFDRNGTLLYAIHGDQNREFVSLEDIPEHTKWALLAAEDIDFYQHKGIDLIGIARSAYNNIVLKSVTASGSTISQQLVKTTLLFDILGEEAYQKTYSRKIKEILITMQMEQSLSKDEILQLYMNEVPLGGVNYGFQAAAGAYFGKDVKDLTLAESALIAGLIQRPGVSSPLFGTNPEEAKVRQNYVLDQMLLHADLTGVTKKEIENARDEELVYTSKEIDIKAPHFVFYVKQLLVDEFGSERVEQGGLKVTTSLDYSLQKIAEEEIKNGVVNYGRKWGVQNGAMIVIDPKTGEVLSMVGSIDYNKTDDPRIDGNVNVTISPRQMGSSVKPYTYLTAFHQGYGPWLLVPDIKNLNFGNYKVLNWDNIYYGLMTAREGLIKSRNIPAIYTMQLVGIDKFIETAETFGITTLTQRDRYGLSLTLGTAEMELIEHTNSFATFANGGVKRDTKAILEVKDSKGNTLIEKEENKGKKIWDEKEIYLLNWILCDLGGFGDQPNNKYYFYNGRRTYCGKTGTTNGPRDLVSILYHKNLVVGVWTGNNNNVETPGAWSTTVPLPIASSFMNRVSGKYKPETFTRPSGISAVQVCNDTGEVASKDSNCKKVQSIYINGKAPKPDKRKSYDLCSKEKVLPEDKSLAEQFDLLVKYLYIPKKLENTFQQANYEAFLKASKSPKYLTKEPETGACELPLGPNNAPVIVIKSPGSNSEFKTGETVSMEFEVKVLKKVSLIEVYIDNSLIGGMTDSPYKYDYVVPSSLNSGVHVIKVKIVDSEGKSSYDSVDIKVKQVLSNVTLSIDNPGNGAVVTVFPVSLSALLEGEMVEKVTFIISGSGYNKEVTDSSSSGGWNSLWEDDGIVNGSYNIKAKAYRGSNTYDSSPIVITVNKPYLNDFST